MPSALDGLNRSQSAAVTHPGGPLIVVAGAGTGKTRTLTRRFAWMVEQGRAPDEILALTFSAPAAAEMRERLESILLAPYEELHVATFHSFCARLLQDEALEAGLGPVFSPGAAARQLRLPDRPAQGRAGVGRGVPRLRRAAGRRRRRQRGRGACGGRA